MPMQTKEKVRSQPSIYLSLTTPHMPAQAEFLHRLEEAIRSNGITPRSLGRSDWSFEAPLIPIRYHMSECSGAIVVAMTRTEVTSGIIYPGGDHERSLSDYFLSTVWVQIEAAMAFQLELPILILREDKVSAEGILDPKNTGLEVRTFSLGDDSLIDPDFIENLADFGSRVKAFEKRRLQKIQKIKSISVD